MARSYGWNVQDRRRRRRPAPEQSTAGSPPTKPRIDKRAKRRGDGWISTLRSPSNRSNMIQKGKDSSAAATTAACAIFAVYRLGNNVTGLLYRHLESLQRNHVFVEADGSLGFLERDIGGIHTLDGFQCASELDRAAFIFEARQLKHSNLHLLILNVKK